MDSRIEIREALEKELNERNHYHLNDDVIVILDEETIETESYFVFFYNSKKYIETQNFSFYLAGNAAIIVSKPDGEKFITGTAHPTDHYIDLYEKGLLTKHW